MESTFYIQEQHLAAELRLADGPRDLRKDFPCHD